jgi:hypothetical protein
MMINWKKFHESLRTGAAENVTAHELEVLPTVDIMARFRVHGEADRAAVSNEYSVIVVLVDRLDFCIQTMRRRWRMRDLLAHRLMLDIAVAEFPHVQDCAAALAAFQSDLTHLYAGYNLGNINEMAFQRYLLLPDCPDPPPVKLMWATVYAHLLILARQPPGMHPQVIKDAIFVCMKFTGMQFVPFVHMLLALKKSVALDPKIMDNHLTFFLDMFYGDPFYGVIPAGFIFSAREHNGRN